PYLVDNWHKAPNVPDGFFSAVPGPVKDAYWYAHQHADSYSGTFRMSAETLARKLGIKDIRHAQRVLARLKDAGLIRQLSRGSKTSGHANEYQLVHPNDITPDQVERLRHPLYPRSCGPGRSRDGESRHGATHEQVGSSTPATVRGAYPVPSRIQELFKIKTD